MRRRLLRLPGSSIAENLIERVVRLNDQYVADLEVRRGALFDHESDRVRARVRSGWFRPEDVVERVAELGVAEELGGRAFREDLAATIVLLLLVCDDDEVAVTG